MCRRRQRIIPGLSDEGEAPEAQGRDEDEGVARHG